MKLLIILSFCLFNISLGSDRLEIDIGQSRYDFRSSVLCDSVIKAGSENSQIFIDSRYLANSSMIRERFGVEIFGLNLYKIGNDSSLKECIGLFLSDKKDGLGSFYKRETTVVKVIKKNEIFLLIASEAERSEIVINPGDVIILQDLGDLF